jgi:hypothetical protein
MNADKHRYKYVVLAAKNAKGAKSAKALIAFLLALFAFFAGHYSLVTVRQDAGRLHSQA